MRKLIGEFSEEELKAELEERYKEQMEEYRRKYDILDEVYENIDEYEVETGNDYDYGTGKVILNHTVVARKKTGED